MLEIRETTKLGEIIKTARLASGLTQKDLAAACGTGRRFIVDLEQGKPTCHLGKAIRVITMLGLKIKIESEPE